MFPRILSLDFDKSDKTWVAQVLRPDKTRASVKLRADAFENIQKAPMGQFLLHLWFVKAPPLPEAQATP
jgi:hypothetical protein